MTNMQTIKWDEIKAWIVENTKEDFRPAHAPFNVLIDTFFDLIKSPVNENALNGIPEIYPVALQRILVDEKDMPSQFRNVGRIESLLRKILYIVNRTEYEQQKEDRDGLSKIIETLGLNKNNINLNWDSLRDYQKTNYATQLLLAYRLRNMESHYCESLSKLKIQLTLKDIIIVYLFAIDEHYESIKLWQKSKDIKRNNYLNKIETDFKEWNGRFVPIVGQEQFSEIALYAVETRTDSEKPREGEVEQLREDLASTGQNQMIIVGEAGLGKTTSMKYLALRDARQGHLPIYIELKLQTKETSLKETILEKLRLVSDDIKSLTQDNNTCIFLDGINEVQPDLKPNVINEIKKLINIFPKVFFLISTRPQDYRGELGNIPVFSLQKMDMGKIKNFLTKNTNQKSIRTIILDAMNSNKEWESILGTPLILFMLIRVVSKDGILPDDKNKIIIRFIKLLYEREKEKDYSFDSDYFHGLICHIAYQSVMLNGTNSALSFPTIKMLLQDSASIADKDLLYILKKAVELNILVRDGVLYSFSHQQYQDTLAGDYANTLFSL